MRASVFAVLLLVLYGATAWPTIDGNLESETDEWKETTLVESVTLSNIDWRFQWSDTGDFYFAINGTLFPEKSYLFIAFALQATPSDATVTTNVRVNSVTSLDIPFKADVLLQINSTSYGIIDNSSAPDSAYIFAIVNSTAVEGVISDSRWYNDTTGNLTALYVTCYYLPITGAAVKSAPKYGSSFFGFFSDWTLPVELPSFVDSYPYATRLNAGSWEDPDFWVNESVPTMVSPNLASHVIVRSATTIKASTQIGHLTLHEDGNLDFGENVALTIGNGSFTAYLTVYSTYGVTGNETSRVILNSPSVIDGYEPITMFTLELAGSLIVESNINITLTKGLEMGSAKYQGNPIKYQGASLTYSLSGGTIVSGDEWADKDSMLDLDEALGVPSGLIIAASTSVNTTCQTLKAVGGDVTLSSNAKLFVQNCALQVTGGVFVNATGQISVANSTLKSASIAADANIKCIDGATVWIGPSYEIPWPLLTVTGGTVNPNLTVTWNENLEYDHIENGLTLQTPNGWSDIVWVRGNQTVSSGTFLLVTSYGDYTVTGVNTNTSCESSIVFKVAKPANSTSSGNGSSGLAKPALLGIVIAVPSGVVLISAALIAAVLMRRNRGSKDDLELAHVKEWEIDYNEINISKELGRGAFGVVYLCKWRNTVCVVKQLDASKTDLNSVKQFLKEANNVKDLRSHPNVCTIFGICTNPTCIVMEYVPGGSLEEFLYKDKLKITAQTVIEWGKDIASGMGHLHKENVLHCDLAARNILVNPTDGKYVLKIADFGLSRVTNDDTYNASNTTSFPIRWTAPETLRGGKISRASDVWSFGVVLWEIIECKRPYPDLTNKEVMQQVCDKGLKPPFPEKIEIPKELWNLMQRCWTGDPDERPSFDDIYTELERIQQLYYPKRSTLEGIPASTQVTDSETYNTETYHTISNMDEQRLPTAPRNGSVYGNETAPTENLTVYGNSDQKM